MQKYIATYLRRTSFFNPNKTVMKRQPTTIGDRDTFTAASDAEALMYARSGENENVKLVKLEKNISLFTLEVS